MGFIVLRRAAKACGHWLFLALHQEKTAWGARPQAVIAVLPVPVS
ncbi:hypothetical protein [Acidovorax sp. NO-1]|jgi:hypothetical protein|nr:hypothetical protein [Acidovorax sp. NO-1]